MLEQSSLDYYLLTYAVTYRSAWACAPAVLLLLKRCWLTLSSTARLHIARLFAAFCQHQSADGSTCLATFASRGFSIAAPTVWNSGLLLPLVAQPSASDSAAAFTYLLTYLSSSLLIIIIIYIISYSRSAMIASKRGRCLQTRLRDESATRTSTKNWCRLYCRRLSHTDSLRRRHFWPARLDFPDPHTYHDYYD